MKKTLCLMLTLLLALPFGYSLAEAAGDRVGSFLLIPEGEPVPVYTEITDAEPADALESGKLCGLLKEVSEQEVLWDLVVYADREKKAAIGYVRADQVILLATDEFQALMQSTEKMNEVLDLLQAIDEILSEKTQQTAAVPAGSGIGGSSGSQPPKKTGLPDFRAFYNTAMQSLDKILNAGLPPEIGNAADTVRDLTQRAVKAGADAANSAIGGISGFIQENSGKVIPKATEDLKQILEKAGDSVSAFKENSGKVIPKATEDLKQILEKAEDSVSAFKENFENSLLPEYKEKAGELYEQARELAGEGVTVRDVLQSWVEQATSLEGIASQAPSLVDSIGAGVLSGADTLNGIIDQAIRLIPGDKNE